MDVSAQAERGSLSFLCLFVLFMPSTDWMMPTRPHWGGPFALLSSPIQMLIFPETPSQANPKMFYQLSGHPLAQSS